VQDFRNLQVWQKAHKLVVRTYAETACLLAAREYDLRRQLLRAATSVPANIAEGCGRGGDRELRRFCRIALGSATELEYHLLLIRDLGLLGEPEYMAMAPDVVEVKRMLAGFINRLTIELSAES
jgi:four helix bundle protein